MSSLGELLVTSYGSFLPSRHVQRSCPFMRGTASNHHKYLQFKIPWSKTKFAQGEWITLTETFDEVDPIAAFEHHLYVNSKCPPHAPLFSYETSSGWTPLTRSVFMERCNNIWTSYGLGTIFGHGFRIGGTTFLLLSGIDPWIVMKQGRWSSKAFLLYWRKIEAILPLFIGNALDNLQPISSVISRLATL